MRAQLANKRARVNSINANDAVRRQPRAQVLRGAVIGVTRGKFANHKPGDLRRGTFNIIIVDAVVANFRGRHDQDLPRKTWVAQRLLIATHGRAEHHFALGQIGGRNCAKTTAMKDRSIFKGQTGRGGGLLRHKCECSDATWEPN